MKNCSNMCVKYKLKVKCFVYNRTNEKKLKKMLYINLIMTYKLIIMQT